MDRANKTQKNTIMLWLAIYTVECMSTTGLLAWCRNAGVIAIVEHTDSQVTLKNRSQMLTVLCFVYADNKCDCYSR